MPHIVECRNAPICPTDFGREVSTRRVVAMTSMSASDLVLAMAMG